MNSIVIDNYMFTFKNNGIQIETKDIDSLGTSYWKEFDFFPDSHKSYEALHNLIERIISTKE